MSKARIYARNLAANWIGYGANLVVLFILSPFVVHRLGTEQYGVWSLLMSLTGYLGLVELGTRASLGRHINYYLGKEDILRVNGVLNTALAIFLAVGVALILAALALAGFLGHIFTKIPADALPAARVVLFLVAANLWLSFLGAGFRQVLIAHERFDLGCGIDLVVLAVRAGGTVAVLLAGQGIVALAAVQVLSSCFGVLGSYVLSRRQFPALTLTPSLVSAAHFRELFGFGIWAFIGSIAMQLLYQTDLVVIAILLGPKQVAYYAIAGMLILYARNLVGQCSSIFAPQMIKDCARQDWPSLRSTFLRGSTLVMAVAIPIFVGLIVFGREFIVLWMGPDFAVSYPVLAILAFSQFVAVAFFLASPVYHGLNRVRLAASMTLSQGLINLGLTLLFVILLSMGINGVAWGSFYPRLVYGVLGGAIAMRWFHLRWLDFLSSAVWRWLAAAVAFAAVCLAVAAAPWAGRWPYFAGKVAVAMAAYLPLAWVILATGEDRRRVQQALTGLLSRLIGRVQAEPPGRVDRRHD